MSKMKIKKGDRVIVLCGDDKGKVGEVTKALPREGKVVVAGINTVKRHQKPSQTSPGGIISKDLAINVSNVALMDPKSGKATRIGYKEVKGEKVRIARKSGEAIEK